VFFYVDALAQIFIRQKRKLYANWLQKVSEMQRPYFVVPAPMLFIAVIGMAVVLEQLWPWSTPEADVLVFVGWALLDGGAVFLLWTVWLMFWRKTTLNPYGKPQRLLTEGPFRISRNPLYIGILVMYLGISLIWGSVWALLLSPMLVVLLQLGIIRHEEQLLLKHFGTDYEQYCKKVRRWL
jgi:protein-S-isoprenylcysteine O-methyltransferase Ste14